MQRSIGRRASRVLETLAMAIYMGAAPAAIVASHA